MNKNKELTERLSIVYKRSGMTQTEFAKRIGITRQQLNNLLTGKQLPSIGTVINICKVFYIMKEWLLNGEGSMEYEIKHMAQEQEMHQWNVNENIKMMNEKIFEIDARLKKLEAKK